VLGSFVLFIAGCGDGVVLVSGDGDDVGVGEGRVDAVGRVGPIRRRPSLLMSKDTSGLLTQRSACLRGFLHSLCSAI